MTETKYYVDLTDDNYSILDSSKGYDLTEYKDGELLDITRYIDVLGYELVPTVKELTEADDLRAVKALLLFDCDKPFRQAIKEAKSFNELKANIYEVNDDLGYYDFETDAEYSEDSELYEHGIFELNFTKDIPLSSRTCIELTGKLELDGYDEWYEYFSQMYFNTDRGIIRF